ncbi:hypothetical protein B0H11DRAFT_2224993 [Mycena galericulata]|nr:hypothetical protein B0H11DRAFT_2224993 [Mycena galericulata]
MQLFKSLILVQDFRGFCALNVQTSKPRLSFRSFPISTFLLISSDRGYHENTPSFGDAAVSDDTNAFPSPRLRSRTTCGRSASHILLKANTDAPPQHAHT